VLSAAKFSSIEVGTEELKIDGANAHVRPESSLLKGQKLTGAPKTLKVLMINKFHYLRGGTERYCFDMTKLLQSRGHKVIPFSMKHERNCKSEYANYFVEEMSFERSANLRRPLNSLKAAIGAVFSLEARQKVDLLIRVEKPDIAYLHNIHYQLSLSILTTLKKHRVPVIWRLHDYALICPNWLLYTRNALCESCIGGHYHHAVLRRCLKSSVAASLVGCCAAYLEQCLRLTRFADLLVAPSNFLREKMLQGGFDNQKLLTIPNFVELDAFQQYRHQPPSFGRQEDDRIGVLYFGRLSKEKGLITLISAVARTPSARATIVGEGLERQDLESIAHRAAPGRIEFTGYQPPEELLRILGSSKIVVVPSEWHENCPYAILESFAAGKPVIASNIGGIPELIQHGKDGLLFQPGNAGQLADWIRFLMDDSDLAKQLGSNGRRKIEEKYRADLHYEKWLEFCARVM
jgi:glycosyltransferase involved in cell wall biosynthesis